ncbi:hypothetical protein BH10ACT1_BH10ACT1_22390 [soil metagenome]
MTIEVRALLGHRGEDRYAGRVVDTVEVGVLEAGRRRFRRSSAAALDVVVDLDEPLYLFDGAVLHDDGTTLVAVARPTMDTLVVRFDEGLELEGLLQAAVLVGHAFGNQHVGLEVVGREVLVPVTTSPQVALATIERLALPVTAVVEPRRLGLAVPLCSPPSA